MSFPPIRNRKAWQPLRQLGLLARHCLSGHFITFPSVCAADLPLRDCTVQLLSYELDVFRFRGFSSRREQGLDVLSRDITKLIRSIGCRFEDNVGNVFFGSQSAASQLVRTR